MCVCAWVCVIYCVCRRACVRSALLSKKSDIINYVYVQVIFLKCTNMFVIKLARYNAHTKDTKRETKEKYGNYTLILELKEPIAINQFIFKSSVNQFVLQYVSALFKWCWLLLLYLWQVCHYEVSLIYFRRNKNTVQELFWNYTGWSRQEVGSSFCLQNVHQFLVHLVSWKR